MLIQGHLQASLKSEVNRVRVVEETLPDGQAIAFVLTGDGRTESKVLSAIAERYNGRTRVLLFPKSKRSKKTGLGALEAIEPTYKLTGHARYLVLIDREHFSEEELHKKLSILFRNYRVETTDPYIILTGEFEIYLVVLGEKIAIEEHLAKLINLETGKEVIQLEHADIDSLKRQIKTFIKTNGHKTITKFIRSCKLKNIELAFKPLVEVLKTLESMEKT